MATEEGSSGLSTPCSSTSSQSEEVGSFSDESVDEGESEWDVLGRMNSLRRSSLFDKPHFTKVTLTRTPAGYGLELQGSSPAVISHVSGTTAEGACVYEGDRVLEVNGVSVRGASHQEVGRLVADCPHTVTLLLHSHKPKPVPSGSTVYSGWLGKKGGSGITPRNWRRRWFVLKDDCIAYYYGSPEDTQALGAIVLRNYTISKAAHDVKKAFAFKLVKGGSRTYCLCADTEQEMNKWAQVFTEAATLKGRETVHFSGTAHNVSLSALSIRDPDCHGFLFKQGYNIRSWKKRYCVLKDHQLFYYGKMHHTTAYGVMNLHGYSVAMGRTTEKKFYFQAPPPERHMRTYYFYCETAVERDRWVRALEKCTEAHQ
jgi:hypothetical protein